MFKTVDLDVERALSVGDGDERALVKKWWREGSREKNVRHRSSSQVLVIRLVTAHLLLAITIFSLLQ